MIGATQSYSQSKVTTPAGVYNLQGVREMASGFELDEDSTFKFYFSYGALDRYGSGRWHMLDSSIVFNSTVVKERDFKLVNSVAIKGNQSIIQIKDKNKFFYRYVYCRVKTAKGDTILGADNEGRIKLPFKVDSVDLLFEFCPEKNSRFAISKSIPKVYTFQFEPWITELFFKDFTLLYKHDQLEGKHPLLTGIQHVFVKEDLAQEKENMDSQE
jgi:hypothetical protein